MSVTPTTTSGASSTLHSQGHHPHHHRGRRLKHFLLPDGKKVHIALSPEEAESLRQRLNAISKDEPFDIVINASPEHLDALRQAHSHHAMRRETLRQTHGQAFDDFEDVRAELDALGDELHMLTDHAVALDASFSKYGYSAHLRTYDDTTPGSSTVSGGFHDHDHVKKDWEAERRNGRVMKLYKKPVVRQYFHRGLLWRASGLAEVASFELFVDLLYVGILAINGDHASEETTGHELLRFCITFIMSWKIWSDIALIVSILKWFETDDIVQRISVLFIMACLLGLTINMLEAFEKTYVQLVAFYLAARLFMAAYFIALAGAVAMVRAMMITQSIIIIIPCALWIASIHVEMPLRLVPAWLAIFLDLCASMFIVFIIRGAKLFSKTLKGWVERIFEFYPAVNIEHRVERTNAFVTLVFGYAVVAIIYQNAGSNGVNAFYGKAILGLIQSFSFNWIYFEIDGADLFAHAIRRNVISALLWSSIHLPFIMAFVLGAAALSKLVVANDCPNASLETLTIFYMDKSEPDIPVGLRWFYCGGLGIALFCMGLISVSHIHKEAGGTRLKKVYRLSNRLGVCIVLFCLPLANNLNSLQLISIVTGLVVWVLLLELWGVSCPKDSFFGEKNTCNYTARCKASKLQSAAKSGGIVHVKDLNDGAEKGMYELS